MTTIEGVSILEQERDHASQPSGSDFASDPAASLRALALSTLKSKRRKPPSASSVSSGLPSRPMIITSSIQLDYGQEESTGVSTVASSSSGVSTITASATDGTLSAKIESVPIRGDTAQYREEDEIEEGEISDSATVLPNPAKDQTIARSSDALKHSDVDVPPVAKPRSPLTPPSLDSIVPPAPALDIADGNLVTGPSQARPPSNPLYTIDENHVRPGLASESLVSSGQMYLTIELPLQ